MQRLSLYLLFLSPCLLTAADWDQFRGPNASGLSDAKPPLKWSQDEDQNIAWAKDLPGRGPSSPIVVKNKVIVTSASGFRQDRLHLLCFDGDSGKKLWERRFWATGRTATHSSISSAAPTPASDGQYIYAFFSSNDLICLNLEGELQWYRGLAHDHPKAGNDIGMSSSPVVVDGVVVVQVENQGDSFAAGVRAADGKTLWRVPRPAGANWCSPAVFPGKGQRKTAILLQSSEKMTAHHPQTGEELWKLEGECSKVPSPIASGSLVLSCANGLTALKFNEQSDAPERLWDSNLMRPGSASPIVYKGHIYTLNNSILKCGDLQTGQRKWQLRLKGKHWATPVVANGHIYCINDSGLANVVKLDGEEKGEIVATNQLKGYIHSSPAVANDAIYLRSNELLWKIAKP